MIRTGALACALALSAAPAWGNGRLPMAGQVALSPRDPDLLLLRTTFGIVLSRDHGASFGYVCERAMHYGGAQDPPYALTPSGGILLVSSLGFVRGASFGSHFDATVAMRGGRDLTVDYPSNRSWVLASMFQRQDPGGAYAFRSRLYRGDAEGEGIARDEGQWLAEDALYETLEVVPGDASRLLMSGATHGSGQPDRAFLALSEDAGEHFHRVAVPLIGRESSVYIAGIDRAGDAARVFLRTAGGSLTPGRLLIGDISALMEHARKGEQAGATLREVLRFGVPMLGFALDGAGAVYAGGDEGVFRADASALEFEKVASIRARCLAARPGELWACADEASGFLLGLSRDRGASFQPMLRLAQVETLVPGEEVQAACAEELATMRRELTAPVPVPDARAPRRLMYVAALALVVSAIGLWIRRRSRRSRAAR